MVEELSQEMGYGPGSDDDIDDAIEAICNDAAYSNEYEFDAVYSTYSNIADDWNDYCDEIDEERPFVYCMHGEGTVPGVGYITIDHAVAAIGYKTTGSSPSERWRIVNYNGSAVDKPCYLCEGDMYPQPGYSYMYTRITTVTPGGGTWSGTYTKKTMWSGNVDIDGSVTFDNDMSLTILPASTIKFGGNYSITVQSGVKIIAEGTAANHIKFTKNTTNWNRILVYSDDNHFKYCDFEYSNYGMEIHEFMYNPIEYCTFKNIEEAAISAGTDASYVKIYSTEISNAGIGIYLYDNIEAYIKDSSIHNNSWGIWSEYNTLIVEKCNEIRNNTYDGIYSRNDEGVFLNDSDDEEGGNSIHDNGRDGVHIEYCDLEIDLDGQDDGNSIYDNERWEAYSDYTDVDVYARNIYWGSYCNDEVGGTDPIDCEVCWCSQTDMYLEPYSDNDESCSPYSFPKISVGTSPEMSSYQDEVIPTPDDIPIHELKQIIEEYPDSQKGKKALVRLRRQIHMTGKTNPALITELVDYLEMLYTTQKETMVGKRALVYLVSEKEKMKNKEEAIALSVEGLKQLEGIDSQMLQENLVRLYMDTQQFDQAEAVLDDLKTKYYTTDDNIFIINYLERQINNEKNGSRPYRGRIVEGTTGSIELDQSYPNPGNPGTTIRFRLPEANLVFLRIFNILGQEVKTLVNDHRQADVYTVLWDGNNNRGLEVPSGTYLYTLKAGKKVITKKLILMK